MQKSLFVKKIRTYEELKLAMEVLVKGFGWSKNHANLIINTLITNKNKYKRQQYVFSDERKPTKKSKMAKYNW